MRWCYVLLLGAAVSFSATAAERSDFGLTLRSQAPTSAENIRFQAHYDQQQWKACLLYTSPSPRDRTRSRMPSSA